MKFKMKFGYAVYILTGFVVAITVASAVINIMILTGAGRFVKGNPAVTSVSLACSLILFALCLALLINSCYTFKEKQLTVWYGLIRVRYGYPEIIAAAEDETSKKLYLQLLDTKNKDGFSITVINIDSKLNADFVARILEKNPAVKHKDGGTPKDDTEG